MGPTFDLSDLPNAMKLSIEKIYTRVLVKTNMT